MTRRLPILCRIFLVLFSFVLCSSRTVRADIDDTGVGSGETLVTNPKTRDAKVTAKVEDIVPPSIPILVSPENNALLNTNTFPFIWKQSTDERGIAKYQLYLNGVLYTDNIGPGDETTSTYTYTESGGLSTLQLNSSLADGAYTWKIRAYDNFGNSTDSTTWNFTIDTTAPILVITQIGDKVVSISAQDSSTIPSSPILLTENEPVVVGNTEANATVLLSISIPGESVIHLTTTAGGDGSFDFTLPVLPRDVVITLQFYVTDAAGNTAIIDGIPIKIITQVIIPPSPIKEIIPEIPIPQPGEIRKEIIKNLEKIIPPEIIESFTRATPLANSLLGFLVPLLKLTAAFLLTGASLWSLTPRFFTHLAHAAGLLPLPLIPPVPLHRTGLVFNAVSRDPVPYGLVTVLMKDEHQQEPEWREIDEIVADRNGQYETIHLKDQGDYLLVPSHRDYVFDMQHAIDRFSKLPEVYKGQHITADACTQPIGNGGGSEDDHGLECADHALLIHYYLPLEPKDQKKMQEKSPHRSLRWMASTPASLLGATTVVMAVIAFLSPTVWNIGMCVVYGGITFKRWWS